MKYLLCFPLALACSAAPEVPDTGSAPSTEGEIEVVSHDWQINEDGTATCGFGAEAAHAPATEEVGEQQQRFVVADNYGDDQTVPNSGSKPTGARCPYVRGGKCMVPGVKSFSWNISGFKTSGPPDTTNLPFFALGDSLDYHTANSAMKWSFKTSKYRVLFVQDNTVAFAQSDIPYRKVYSSTTFGTVNASVPDEQAIRVRFNYDAMIKQAKRIGVTDYWSVRVYFEHMFSHEMGHVSGLGHSPHGEDLMYFEAHPGNWSTNWLTDGELQAIAAFSPGDWSDATVLDLDL